MIHQYNDQDQDELINSAFFHEYIIKNSEFFFDSDHFEDDLYERINFEHLEGEINSQVLDLLSPQCIESLLIDLRILDHSKNSLFLHDYNCISKLLLEEKEEDVDFNFKLDITNISIKMKIIFLLFSFFILIMINKF